MYECGRRYRLDDWCRRFTVMSMDSTSKTVRQRWRVPHSFVPPLASVAASDTSLTAAAPGLSVDEMCSMRSRVRLARLNCAWRRRSPFRKCSSRCRSSRTHSSASESSCCSGVVFVMILWDEDSFRLPDVILVSGRRVHEVGNAGCRRMNACPLCTG